MTRRPILRLCLCAQCYKQPSAAKGHRKGTSRLNIRVVFFVWFFFSFINLQISNSPIIHQYSLIQHKQVSFFTSHTSVVLYYPFLEIFRTIYVDSIWRHNTHVDFYLLPIYQLSSVKVDAGANFLAVQVRLLNMHGGCCSLRKAANIFSLTEHFHLL